MSEQRIYLITECTAFSDEIVILGVFLDKDVAIAEAEAYCNELRVSGHLVDTSVFVTAYAVGMVDLNAMEDTVFAEHVRCELPIPLDETSLFHRIAAAYFATPILRELPSFEGGEYSREWESIKMVPIPADVE